MSRHILYAAKKCFLRSSSVSVLQRGPLQYVWTSIPRIPGSCVLWRETPTHMHTETLICIPDRYLVIRTLESFKILPTGIFLMGNRCHFSQRYFFAKWLFFHGHAIEFRPIHNAIESKSFMFLSQPLPSCGKKKSGSPPPHLSYVCLLKGVHLTISAFLPSP